MESPLGPPLETSLLASQIDPQVRSRIEFPCPGKVTNGQLLITEEPLTRQLFRKILQGKEDKDSLEWQNFERLSSWSDQLHCFIISQELTPEELQLRWQICLDILTILRTIRSECDAQIFGSLFTGLADPHSGIDICIDPLGDYYTSLKSLSEENRRAIISGIHMTITETLLKAQSPHHLSGYFVSKMESVRKNMTCFVGFQLNHFNLKVNLSLGNRLLVQNSKLLKFYLNYDPRVKHLIVFLRYWTKFHGLSDWDKLNPYAISLLVIVFLANKRIVPSVILLQSLAEVQRMTQGNPDMIQGWDASFCEDLELIIKNFKPLGYRKSVVGYWLSKETYSKNEGRNFLNLLAGFFKMISKTDFSSVIFSPQIGKIVPKMEMNSVGLSMIRQLQFTQLTKWREGQWKVNRIEKFCSALNIQDPFNLDMNVTDLCKKETLDKFVETSQAAFKILKNGFCSLLDLFVRDENANVGESYVPRVEGVLHLKITSVPQREVITNETPKRKEGRKKNGQKTEATPSQVTATLEVDRKDPIPPKKKNKKKKRTPKDEPKSNILNPNELVVKTMSQSETTLSVQQILQQRLSSMDMEGFRMLALIDQLSKFTQSLGLSQEDIEARCQACADIVFTLRTAMFPECDANLSGSLFCLLADSHSNVNLSFDPYGDNYKTLKALNLKENFKVCDYYRIQIAKVLKQGNLKKSYKLVDKTWTLTKHSEKRRVAVLQIKRQDWDFTVQLSIGNWTSVQTSRLLRFYLNYDPRVRHLIQFLRYWTKFHGLADNEKLNPMIVNLLVLVYLANEKIVPSIILLQTLAEMQERNPEKIQDRDISVTDDLEYVQKYFKPSTVHPSKEMYTKNLGKYFPDLLSGFFEMITGTKFSSVMFCPLFGTILSRGIKNVEVGDISELENLPQTLLSEWRIAQWNLGRDKIYCSELTIQDPFLLDVNLGKSWDSGLLQKFLEASEKTLKILTGGSGSLLNLFGFHPTPASSVSLEATLTNTASQKATPTIAIVAPTTAISTIAEPPEATETTSFSEATQTLPPSKVVPKTPPISPKNDKLKVNPFPPSCQQATPPTLEKSLLARQMDPELRSRIQFTFSCNFLQSAQNDSTAALLYHKLLLSVNEDVSLSQLRHLPINDQFSSFIQSQPLSAYKFIQIRWQVCVEILAILRREFPRCDAYVLGSLANGLVDKDSNINLCFDPHGDNFKTMEASSFEQADCIRLKIVETLGKYEGESTCLQKTCSSFQYKTWILTRDVHGNKIKCRKVAYLQIDLAKLGFKMELCIGNRLFVQSTKLLQFYLNYDPRVKHLILFVRCWAKFYELMGQGNLKQFVINLLVLVYLAKEKIVPSVILLQTLTDIPDMIQGYDASFCEDLELIQKYFKPSAVHPSKEMYAKNQGSNFPNLVVGFFEMITGTELASVMFCPHFGTILPRDAKLASLMANDILDKLPQTRLTDWRRSHWLGEMNIVFSPLTIQDPFQLDVNMGKHCDSGLLKKFLGASKKTLKALRVDPSSVFNIFIIA